MTSPGYTLRAADNAPQSQQAIAQVTAVADWSGERAGSHWAIFCGDALARLQTLPAEAVHCIVTSPPYFWLRDYGVDSQLGLERTVDEYVENLCAVLNETHRVLRQDGLLFLNIGDTYYSGKGRAHGADRINSKRRFGLRLVDEAGGLGMGLKRKSLIGIPWRVGLALMSSGWTLRSSLIWHKDSPVPDPVRDRPARAYEHVHVLAKSDRYYFDKASLIEMDGGGDVWTIPAITKPNNGLATAPFPDELVERLLAIGAPAGGVVLDPFMGSGTTLRVALSTGRSGIGIDLNRDFCRYAAQALAGQR